MEVMKIPRKNEFENNEEVEEKEIQLITENGLINAKLDHIIKLLTKE